MPTQKELMRKAGEKVLEYIPETSKHVVFGAGRTVIESLRAFHEAKMPQAVICASHGTKKAAEELGISIAKADELGHDGIYIDGADQVDPKGNLIKGGNKGLGDPGKEGAMYKEKHFAYRAGKFIVVADDSKLVSNLGQDEYGVPVEYLQEYEDKVKEIIYRYTSNFKMRLKPDGKPFVTENGNYIFDLVLKEFNPITVEEELEEHKEIFATGLFAVRKPDIAIVAYPDRVEVKEF